MTKIVLLMCQNSDCGAKITRHWRSGVFKRCSCGGTVQLVVESADDLAVAATGGSGDRA